jgi:hypothetical protein
MPRSIAATTISAKNLSFGAYKHFKKQHKNFFEPGKK